MSLQPAFASRKAVRKFHRKYANPKKTESPQAAATFMMGKSQFTGLFIDNFAGGGGASTGIEKAIGRSVDHAINHDPNSIAMHTMNHPHTTHHCEDVWDVVPDHLTGGRKIALVWLSPDCKHFSKAKGGLPKEKGIRGLAWVALRWASLDNKPNVMILENVEEFKDWGPLDPDGYAIKSKAGKTFRSFVNALKRHGFEVEWRELRAADFGAPTARKRFFLIARSDGRAIVWPEPTHARRGTEAVTSGLLKPWRAVAEVMDFSRECPSIFGRTKPLAENTERRIARGIDKYVINCDDPFIIKVNHSSDNYRGQSARDPLQTITAKNGYGVVAPTLVQMGYGERPGQEPRALDLQSPLGTVTAGGNKFAVAASHMVKMRGTNTGQSLHDPLQTITAGGNHFGEVKAFLMHYNGASIGQSLSEPINTITTHDRFGLVTIDGSLYQIIDIGMRMLQPRELFNAQGFPSTYIIDRYPDGSKVTQKDQVARVGNSVPPQFAEALVRANLPEYCTGSGNVLSFERYRDEEPQGQLQLSM